MSTTVFSKILFTITFPNPGTVRTHVPLLKLHSLARKQLSDLEVIETIDHLFKCHRCFENYRFVKTGYPDR